MGVSADGLLHYLILHFLVNPVQLLTDGLLFLATGFDLGIVIGGDEAVAMLFEKSIGVVGENGEKRAVLSSLVLALINRGGLAALIANRGTKPLLRQFVHANNIISRQ